MTASFENIVDYFADLAMAEIPKTSKRLESATNLRKSYAQLKIESNVRTLEKNARSIYAITRMPGTLSTLRAVFAQWHQLGLDKPDTILDCGSGPGTALFAALEAFGANTLLTAIEKDPGFIDMASRAIKTLASPAHERLLFINDAIPKARLESRHDLAILSYMLSEIPQKELETVMLWVLKRTQNYVVIADAGTPRVYQQIMAARDILIAQGWCILAPCRHQKKCPLEGSDFCHFSTTFLRHRESIRLKNASAQNENEKYCYLIAAAPHRTPKLLKDQGRIIRRPMQRSGHRVFDLCVREGNIRRVILSKKDGLAYRLAKDLYWGDVL